MYVNVYIIIMLVIVIDMTSTKTAKTMNLNEVDEMKKLFSELEPMVSDACDLRHRKPITIWVTDEYYEKYAKIQKTTKRKFARFMRTAVCKIIDIAMPILIKIAG